MAAWRAWAPWSASSPATRSARAGTDERAAVRPAEAGARPAWRRGPRAARRLQVRDVQPHGLDDVRRLPDSARARRHGRVRRRPAPPRPGPRAARAQQRGPQPGRHDRRPARRPQQGLRPGGTFGGTTTVVFDEHRTRLIRGFVLPQRHHRQLRRRHLLPAQVLSSPANKPWAGRRTPTRRSGSRSAAGTSSRRRSTAARTSSRWASRSRPRAGSRARGRGRRPRGADDDLRDGGPRLGRRRRLLPLHARRPRRPRRRRHARTARDHRASRNVDLRQGRTRGAGAPRQPGCASTTPDPGADQRSPTPAARSTRAGAKGGAKFNRLEGCWEDDGTIFFVSTSGGDVKNGDVNSDGYQGGLRPGLGLPARLGGAARSRWCTSRRAKPRHRRLAGQPDGDAARRPDRVRGRRVLGVPRHASARARG